MICFLTLAVSAAAAQVTPLSASAALELVETSDMAVGIFMPTQCWTCGASLDALDAARALVPSSTPLFSVCFGSDGGRYAGPACAERSSATDPLVARALSLATVHSRSQATVIVFGAQGAVALPLHATVSTSAAAVSAAAIAEACSSLSVTAAGAAAQLSGALRELGSLARPVPAVAADAAAECVPLGAISSIGTPADLAALSEREDVDIVVLGLFAAGATAPALRDALGLAAFVGAAKAHVRAEGGWCAQDEEEGDDDDDAVAPKRYAFAVARDDAALTELAAAHGVAAPLGAVVVLNAAANAVVLASGATALALESVTSAMARAAALEELPQGELLRAHDPRRGNEHDVVLIAFLEGNPGDATFGVQEKELRKSAKRFARSVHHDYISSGGTSARMYEQAASYFGLGASVLRGGTAIAMDYREVPAEWSIPHSNFAALPTASPMKFRLADDANCTRKALRALLDAVARRFDGSGSSADELARYAFVKSAPVPAAEEETAADGRAAGAFYSYRLIPSESCSQFDALPLLSFTLCIAVQRRARRAPRWRAHFRRGAT